MKKIPILAVLMLVSALLMNTAHGLEDNFYFTMPPDSFECTSLTLPTDLATNQHDNYIVEIQSELETNLRFVNTTAGLSDGLFNTVKIPICFYTLGVEEGHFGRYNVTITPASSPPETLAGGICVSDISGFNFVEGHQDPCSIINQHGEDVFSVNLYPSKQAVRPGQPATFAVSLMAKRDLILELNATGRLQAKPQNKLVVLKPYEMETLEFQVTPEKTGKYIVTMDALMIINNRYCNYSFCRKSVKTELYVNGIPPSGWNVYISPRYFSADSLKPVPYTIVIENNDKDADFDIGVKVPAGLKPEWTQKTVRVKTGERKELKLSLVLENATEKNYVIEFLVRGDIEKMSRSYLSFGEAVSDVRRRWKSLKESLKPVTRTEFTPVIEEYARKYKAQGFEPQDHTSMLELLEAVEQGEKPKPLNITVPDKKEQPGFPLTLVAAIAIILAVLILFIYRSAFPSVRIGDGNVSQLPHGN